MTENETPYTVEDTSTNEPTTTTDTTANVDTSKIVEPTINEEVESITDSDDTTDKKNSIKETTDNSNTENRDDIDDTLILGKYKTQADLENAHKSLESKLGEINAAKQQEIEQLQAQRQQELEYYKQQAEQYNLSSPLEAKQQMQLGQLASEFAEAQYNLFSKYANFSTDEQVANTVQKYTIASQTNNSIEMTNALNDLVATLPPSKAAAFTYDMFELHDRAKELSNNITQAIKLEEFNTYEQEKLNFIETNSEFLENEVNMHIVDQYYNKEEITPDDIITMIQAIRDDERAKITQKKTASTANKKAKSKMSSVNDTVSKTEPSKTIDKTKYSVEELLELSKTDPTIFDKWLLK